jgi:hypothetical protein
LDPLQGEIVRPIQRLESESENGNSSLLSNRRGEVGSCKDFELGEHVVKK